MVEVGTLHTKDIFYHKGHEYKVLENSSMFIIAKKIPYDGITRYFLKSIKVEKKLKDTFWTKNPDYDITDRYAR
jgi:hypothetical protein